MKRNSKFSLALHALAHMDHSAGALTTSEEIAQHHETNAVVVRRVLGLLREADLVTSEKGHAGGWALARPSRNITVADVYRAVGESFFNSDSPGDELPEACAIQSRLQQVVDAALFDAEDLLIARLAKVTIEQLRHHALRGDVRKKRR